MCVYMCRAAPQEANGFRSGSSPANANPQSTSPTGSSCSMGSGWRLRSELTVKSQRRITAILDELNSRFDTVLYFCAPGPHRQPTQLHETGRWPALGVRELPQR